MSQCIASSTTDSRRGPFTPAEILRTLASACFNQASQAPDARKAAASASILEMIFSLWSITYTQSCNKERRDKQGECKHASWSLRAATHASALALSAASSPLNSQGSSIPMACAIDLSFLLAFSRAAGPAKQQQPASKRHSTRTTTASTGNARHHSC